MKLFLTGATGYVGHRLALYAANRGYQVQALVRNLQGELPRHPNIRFFTGDITDAASVAQAMEGCQQVIHAAALARYYHPRTSEFFRINVGGTHNVLEAALRQGISRLVFTSTCAVLGPSYGRPVTETDTRLRPFDNNYEVSKYCAEQLVAEYVNLGLAAVIVSMPRVYGPGPETMANPVTKALRQALQTGIAFIPGSTEAVGSYTFIEDVAGGHLLALEKGQAGAKYILGGPNATFPELFETLAAVSGCKFRTLPLPEPLLLGWSTVYGRMASLLGINTQLKPATVRRLFRSYAMSSDKAVQELGYTITPLAQGIAATLQYFKTGNYATH